MDERYTEKKKWRRRTEEEKKKKTPQLRGRYTGRYTGPTEHLNFGSAGPAGLLSKREKQAAQGMSSSRRLRTTRAGVFLLTAQPARKQKHGSILLGFNSLTPTKENLALQNAIHKDSSGTLFFLIVVGGRPSALLANQQGQNRANGSFGPALIWAKFSLFAVLPPYTKIFDRFASRSVSQSICLPQACYPTVLLFVSQRASNGISCISRSEHKYSPRTTMTTAQTLCVIHQPYVAGNPSNIAQNRR